MKSDWMKTLARHYEQACHKFPNTPLLLLCDIDGTVLDMRYLVQKVLHAYDRHHGTSYFKRLRIQDIQVHENQIIPLLEDLEIPESEREHILKWYREERWKKDMLHERQRPVQGALDVIRWFQIQPNTSVGLVTGRPEALRQETLQSLNLLGKPYRVSFSNELLYMNPGGWEENVPDVKVAGLRHFQEMGYHVFAFIDNEPVNLKALAKADRKKEVLLLHAATIFESRQTRVPRGTVRGKTYRLSKLIPDEKALPKHVQLAWHGVNDPANLRQFLASDVHWAEVDALLDPLHWEVILRHDSFNITPLSPDEEWLTLAEVLEKIKAHKRAIKIDMKVGGILLDKVLQLVAEAGLPDEALWFNANIEQLTETGFRRLAESHPSAIVQCPIDFVAPLTIAAPQQARSILEMLTSWGINRFSISWEQPDLRAVFDQLSQWGYEVNIYNVPDLEAFLQAVLLLPRSVTSDFNFPQWQYYGHGSGARGKIIAYKQSKSP